MSGVEHLVVLPDGGAQVLVDEHRLVLASAAGARRRTVVAGPCGHEQGHCVTAFGHHRVAVQMYPAPIGVRSQLHLPPHAPGLGAVVVLRLASLPGVGV